METAILALIVETIGVGTALFSELDARRSSRQTRELAGGLQTVDVGTVVSAIGPVRLAGLMRGGMTAKHAELVLMAPEFRDLMSELLFAAIVEERRDSIKKVIESMRLFSINALRGTVADDDAEFFAEGVGAVMSDICAQIVEQVRDSDPDAVAQMQQVNLLRRVAAILDNIEKHNAALKRSAVEEVRESRQRFIDDYRVVCAEEHGYIRPPDFETNRKIAMEQLYVVPTIAGHESVSGRDVDMTSDYFIGQIDRTVVLGDPGGGKSTLSNYVTALLARDADGPVPFHIILRDFAAAAGQPSVLSFIEQHMAPRYQLEPLVGAVEDLLLTGRAVVIFDGLDELVDPSRRRDMTRAVEIFGIRYPLARIMVTSRRVGYAQARLDPAIFSTHLIDEFSPEEVQEYVEKWFSSQSEYTALQAQAQARDFITQSEAVPDLRANPLMLALMCIIFRGEKFIPRNRPDVYQRCANLLFEKWDGHRGIEVPLQARDHVSAAMKFVAFRFLETESGDSGIAYGALVDMMTDYLYPRAAETREGARKAAEEFVDFCRGRAWVFTDAGTTAEGVSLYKFTHRTFMEYFAAVHLTRINDTPEALAAQLLPRVAREEWDVVAQLAVQQAETSTDAGTERALTAMLQEKRKRTVANRARVLRFIARCTAFAVVSPKFIRELSSACVHHAIDNDLNRLWEDAVVWPWLELVLNIREEDKATALAAQIEDLEAALNSTSTRRTTTIWFLFYGLTRATNFRLHGVPDNGADWWPALIAIVEAHRDAVDEALDGSPAAAHALAWYGLISPAEAIGRMKNAGYGFGQIFFDQPSLFGYAIPGQPISESLLALSTTNWQDRVPEHRAAALGFAEELVKSFHHEAERPAPTHSSSRSRRWHGFGVSMPTFDESTPHVLLEAHVILVLGNLEILAGGRRQPARNPARARRALISNYAGRDGSNELLELAALPIPEAVQQFVRDWLESQSSVFTSPALEDGGAPLPLENGSST